MAKEKLQWQDKPEKDGNYLVIRRQYPDEDVYLEDIELCEVYFDENGNTNIDMGANELGDIEDKSIEHCSFAYAKFLYIPDWND